MAEFYWTPKRDRAAELVADDVLTDEQIAAELKLHVRTLGWWKRAPVFQARVEERRKAIRAAIWAEGIANKQNRIDALNNRWQRMQQVIDQRAERHPTVGAAEMAGASTGLLVLTVRYLPGGGRVEEWAVDTGLLKELREHEKQAATEMGQWSEKTESDQRMRIVVEYEDGPGDAP